MNLIVLNSAYTTVEGLVKTAIVTCTSLISPLWDVLNYFFLISECHWYITLHMAFKLLLHIESVVLLKVFVFQHLLKYGQGKDIARIKHLSVTA